MRELTTDQFVAVQSFRPLILVVAGPGSGKTAVLCKRIEWAAQNCEPQHIAVVTFTNAAAKEIESRIAPLMAESASLGYVGTLHGLMLRLLKSHGHIIGIEGSNLAVLSEENAKRLRDAVISDLDYKGPKKEADEQIACGPPGISWGPKGAGKTGLSELVAIEYFRRMREAGLVDFDGILHYGYHLLRKLGECRAATGEVCGWPFEHLLVDEYQDSGELDRLIYEAAPSPWKFFVGDPDQAIFGFRGGKIENIVRLYRQAVVYKLEENFRCAPEICTAANKLISKNVNRIEKLTLAGSEWCAVEDGGILEIAEAPGEMSEIMGIAKTIEAHGKPHECAVLLRYNSLVERFADQLAGFGIPVARNEWVKQPSDWKLCRQLVNLLANPNNDLLAQWFLEETRGTRYAAKIKFQAVHEGQSINAQHLKLPNNVGIAEVPGILSRCGIEIESRERVAKAIVQLPQGSGLTELSFALSDEDLHRKETGEGVTVTTMHSAKGREWEVVFLPAFENGIIPGGSKSTDIEEERRVAFVAMTRAKRKLVISWSKMRAPNWGSGAPVPAEPSPFLKEIE